MFVSIVVVVVGLVGHKSEFLNLVGILVQTKIQITFVC